MNKKGKGINAYHLDDRNASPRVKNLQDYDNRLAGLVKLTKENENIVK